MRSVASIARVVVLALVAAGCGAPVPPAASPAPSAAKKYETPDARFVFFPAAKADVLPDGLFAIGYVAAQLDADPSMHVLVVGHSDQRGKAEQTRELAYKRARAVRKVLLDHGIKEGHVLIAAPRDAGESTSVTELNRRVDLYVYDPTQDEASQRLGYPVEIRSE